MTGVQTCALPIFLLLGARSGRYSKDGKVLTAHPPSSIPFLALGAWILAVGWFGFNVMSAQDVAKISGLVAMNSLLAMVGGTLAALVAGRNDPGFVHNGPLAGLVAVCAGSDVMHPLGALLTGAIAGGMFVYMFNLTQNTLKIDDVLGVWPLHGLAGTWGGIACGIFGSEALGGLDARARLSQRFDRHLHEMRVGVNEPRADQHRANMTLPENEIAALQRRVERQGYAEPLLHHVGVARR